MISRLAASSVSFSPCENDEIILEGEESGCERERERERDTRNSLLLSNVVSDISIGIKALVVSTGIAPAN